MPVPDIIDFLSDDVLAEMLEHLSFEYKNQNYFYESLNVFLSSELLLEDVARDAREKERIKRLQSASSRRDRAWQRQERKLNNAGITAAMKGKYDRRPLYKRALGRLGRWIKKGIDSINHKIDTYGDQDNTTHTTSRTSSSSRDNNSTQQTPKSQSKLQFTANKIRSEQEKEKNKKKTTFTKFKQKAQEAKFRAMPKPLKPNLGSGRGSGASSSSQATTPPQAVSRPSNPAPRQGSNPPSSPRPPSGMTSRSFSSPRINRPRRIRLNGMRSRRDNNIRP